MTDTTFELYRLLVEDVREARRARRELSNVFMSLNLAGVGALGFLARGENGLEPGLFGWCVAALVLTCLIWRASNSYYTVLLRAKYEEIYELEDKLGISPIRDEWKAIQSKRRIMKWFSLERAMPLLFILGYVVFFAIQFGADGLAALWAQLAALIEGLIARFRG
jgi:hypothetical protein